MYEVLSFQIQKQIYADIQSIANYFLLQMLSLNKL